MSRPFAKSIEHQARLAGDLRHAVIRRKPGQGF
jgi:hypothetical protein